MGRITADAQGDQHGQTHPFRLSSACWLGEVRRRLVAALPTWSTYNTCHSYFKIDADDAETLRFYKKIEPWSLRIAGGYRQSRIEWYDSRVCHVTGSDHAHRFGVQRSVICQKICFGIICINSAVLKEHLKFNIFHFLNTWNSLFPQCKTSIGNNQ